MSLLRVKNVHYSVVKNCYKFVPVIVITILKVHLSDFWNYCWFLYQERSEKNDVEFVSCN